MDFELNPDNFNPKHQASGCIVSYNGKFLFLKRKTNKSPSGFFWAIPAGKVNRGENPEAALKREIKEETGIELNIFEKIKTFKMRLNTQNYDFLYHLFSVKIDNNRTILSGEHDDYRWVSKAEALKLDLETGAELYLQFIE